MNKADDQGVYINNMLSRSCVVIYHAFHGKFIYSLEMDNITVNSTSTNWPFHGVLPSSNLSCPQHYISLFHSSVYKALVQEILQS